MTRRILPLAPGSFLVYVRDVIPSDVWNMKEVSIQVQAQVIESINLLSAMSIFRFLISSCLTASFGRIRDMAKDSHPEWDKPIETVLPHELCRYTDLLSTKLNRQWL